MTPDKSTLNRSILFRGNTWKNFTRAPRSSNALFQAAGRRAVRRHRPLRVAAVESQRSSSSSGTDNSDSQHSVDSMKDTVEMFVAHTADSTDEGILGRARAIAKRIVPPPFASKPGTASPPNAGSTSVSVVEEASSGAPAAASDQTAAVSALASKQTRALQAELGMTSAELQQKSVDLQEAQRQLRHRDGEIQGLKAMLAQKESQIRASRSELVEARVQTQEKDMQLQSALEQLTTAAKERSKLRQELIAAQTDLSETRYELERWSVYLNELKNVMESVDLDALEEQPPGDAQAPEVPAALAADSGGHYLDMLRDLNELASSLVKEAEEDNAVFSKLQEQYWDKDSQS
mmetsp:Transcript_3712/g.8871  ORF Transcript_3712/g.8871 Transcript_3712/m.8871 type:complete len:348 (+) Transcript_3712:319-1362(+)